MSRSPSEDVDSDLQDLLADGIEKNTSSSATSTSTGAHQKLSNYYDDPHYYQRPQKHSFIFRIPELLCYYFTQFLICSPIMGKALILSFLGFIIYSLLTLTTPTQSIGHIKYDFATSKYDFNIGKVDHWCVTGGDECPCPDPLHPQPRMHKAWHKAFRRHQTMIAENPNPDVVFLGQSVVEVMNGYVGGNDMRNQGTEFFSHVNHMFVKKFGKENAMGPMSEREYVTGIAMGLTGDSFSNVLWRLMNGELPDHFDPPIWWLVLGMEDIGRYGCSEEITVMGVLRIVEEIQKQRPNAKIVINSLFPMMTMRQKVEDEQVQNVQIEYKDVEERPEPKKWQQKKMNKMKQMEEGHDRVRRLGGGGGGGGRGNGDGANQKWKQRQQEKQKKKIARIQEKENAKRERKYEKEIHHDEFNPTMKIKEKFRRERGDKGRLHVPVWTAIHEINRELHAFCGRTKHVTFFDSTPLFSQRNEKGDYVLLTDYITVRGHPTPDGFKVWLNAIHEQALQWKSKIVEANEKNKQMWTFDTNYYYDAYKYTDKEVEASEDEEAEEGDDEEEEEASEDEEAEEGDDNEEEEASEDEEAEEGDDDEEEEAEEGDDNEEEEASEDEEAEEGDDDEEEEAEEGDDEEEEAEQDDEEEEAEQDDEVEEGDDEVEEGDDEEEEEAEEGDDEEEAEEGDDEEE